MSNSTALVTIDDLPAPEARLLHMEVKGRGRGEMGKFIEYETTHTPGQYYYRLRKKGVLPFKKPVKKQSSSIVEFTSKRGNSTVTEMHNVRELENKIRQLELQLEASKVTPAQRALDVLSASMMELSHRSRVFLANLISKNSAGLTDKQEKWLSDLEAKHL